ncbi:MAG: hypothetical protein IPL42_12310 [Saprospiraceae bacterium]|nr:hypothetical protein [Saprospiraceae bacterium]
MKHILFKSCRLLLFILLLVFQLQPNLFAQCGNNTISGVSADGSTEDMTSSSLTIRVYFVLVRRNDGSGDIQESILSGIMSELAANYTATHNITFVQGCTQFIDSTSMYNDGSILAVNLTTFGQKYGTGLGITVFIQKEDSGTGILGQAGTNPVFPQPYCWFKYAAVNDIASHEIGHTLNLYHTDFMGFGKPCTAIAAHDTTRGDLVADTPIDYFHSEPVVACAWDTSQCRGRFPNPCLDSCGGFLLNVDPTIIMSNLDYSCVNHFTTGQANRMKKSIMNNTNGTYFDLVDADVTISTNTTISTPTRYARNVIVEPGVSLVVTSTVYMPQKGRIILQPGAILSINGGTITKGTFPDMCNERTGDPKFWYGIEMQTSTSSSYPKLYCTNGTIEFSEFGIHNDSSRVAGNLLINIASGTFRNNKHSIHILRGPYNAALPIFVKKARFYIDGSFPLANYYTQVKIDNSKIYFDSCKFDNPSTKHPLDSNSYSIRAMGATVGIQRTTFKDSLYGVQSLSAISTSTLNVTTSKFSKMFVGVNTTAGVNNYSITKDTFDTSWKYGLLSTQCTGYNINNNLFNNTGYHSNSVGILMQESGVVYNYIQKNVFSYLKYGDIAQGTNGDANVGLQYRCNTHDNNNTKDFFIARNGFRIARL